MANNLSINQGQYFKDFVIIQVSDGACLAGRQYLWLNYRKIRCIVLRVLQTSKGFWVFCSVNHFSEGKVNRNHNNMLSQLG